MTVEQLQKTLLGLKESCLVWARLCEDRDKIIDEKNEIIKTRDETIEALEAEIENLGKDYWFLLEKYNPREYHRQQRKIDRSLVRQFWGEHEHRYHIVIKGKERHVILPDIMYQLVLRNIVN